MQSLLLLALFVQDGTPASIARPPEDDEPVVLDRVHIIVNEDVATLQEVIREFRSEARRRPINSKREQDLLLQQVMSGQVERMLRLQAGHDLGLDPQLIQLQLDGHEERFIERAGSVLDASEMLKGLDLDSSDARELWEGQLFNLMWEESVTGRGPTSIGRRVRDRYIRPGQIRMRYLEYVNPPAWMPKRPLSEIGGQDPKVVLEEILVPGSDPSRPSPNLPTLEEAFSLCEEARQAALDGVTFAELHDRYASGPNRGPQVHEVTWLGLRFPAIGKFLETAQPGEWSSVEPFLSDGRVVAYHFVRLVERKPAVLPSFESAETQKRIKDLLLDEMDRRRIDSALTDLFEAAYVWPPELASPPPRAKPSAETSNQQ